MNPISQTSPSRWTAPRVISNRQSIGVQIGRGLERLGHECTVVIAEPYRPETSDEGVACIYLPVRHTPLSPVSQLPWMRGLGRLALEGGFHAVLTSEVMQWSTSSLCLLRRRGGPPVVVWQEADRFQSLGMTLPARAFFAVWGRRVIGAADGFVPRSEPARRFLAERGAPPAKLGPEMPNPVDLSVFHPCPEQRDTRPLVLHVGTLLRRKNPTVSVHAFARIREAWPTARLIIKGSGEMEGELRKEIGGLGLDAAAHIDTTRSTPEEMARLYNRAWVALFPTSRDLATLSPVEALACGVPVVLSPRLSHASTLASFGAQVAEDDEPGSFASCANAILERYGARGLGPREAEGLRERYSLEACSRRLSDYLESFVRDAERRETGPRDRRHDAASL